MITPYVLRNRYFYTLVSDQFSVSAPTQVWTLESVSRRKNWYWNISKLNLDDSAALWQTAAHTHESYCETPRFHLHKGF